VAQIEAGHLDDIATITLPPQDLEHYYRDPELRRYLKLVPFLATEWVMLNVTQPPLDDIHVRRALSWVLDKAAMVQLEGGTVAGSVATHIAPDPLYGGQLTHYDPYRTPGSHGSIAKAKAAMKGSRYDLKNDGTCSAPVCKNVVLLTETTAISPELATVIQQDAAKIGIGITVRPIGEPYQVLQTVRKQIPMAEFTGMGVSEPDPVAMFWPCFDGREIIPSGNCDWSLLGITRAQCAKMHVTGDCNPYNSRTGLGVPSVNGMLDRCIALAGAPRRNCWEQLEEHLMTQAVPLIPYITPKLPHIISRHVTRWVGDQANGTTAYAHVAVSPS
jgi:ABC-type transport system substrate-binding protein